MVKLSFGDSYKIDEFERRKKTYESFFGLFKCQFVSVLFERQALILICQAAKQRNLSGGMHAREGVKTARYLINNRNCLTNFLCTAL